MLALPKFSTKETDALCREVSKKSNGVCFLGFSRGKDSVCAWLQLRKYFKHVIPFHCCLVPHLRFADEILKYYEYQFETKIVRMQDSALHADIRRMVYQLPEYDEEVDNAGFFDYDKHDIMDLLRKVYGLPNAWCAFGINASDSLERRIYVTNIKGRNPQHKTFYPCYDWPHEEILKTVEDSGMLLSPEYKCSNRTMAGPPQTYWLDPMRKVFPEDFKRLQTFYPLCMSVVARMDFRKENNERAEKQG